MTAINNIIANIVEKIKEDNTFKEIRFLKAFNSREAQNPIRGYLVTVDLKSIFQSQNFIGGYFNENSKGEIYSAKVVFRVYSDRETSGSSLGDITFKLYEDILKADADDLISKSSVGPIEYDQYLETIYREITVNFEFCLCGDVG